MRIGLVIDTYGIGGAESMLFETARLLKDHGDQPVLLHFGSDYMVDFCAENNIEQHVIPNHRLYKKILLLPLFSIKTTRFIKSLNLNTLHSHLFGPIVAFAPLAWLIRLHHVGTLHDVYMIENSPKLIWLIKLASILNTNLIAVSRHMASFYTNKAHFKPDKISYIPNFSESNRELTNRAAIRGEIGLSDQEIAIVSVGRLVALKRFSILIDATANIAKHQRIKTFIVGDGPERQALQDMIEKYDASDRITLLGERDDVERLLAAADIFTLTSETEGMSKSILEALAANLPVIATDVGGNSDLVHDGENGFLLTESTAQNMSQQLNKHIHTLAEDKSLRQKMGEMSAHILKADHSSLSFLERHLQIYRRT